MIEEDTVQIKSGDELKEATVDQLLGFDLSQVEEVRGFPLIPEGVYEWHIKGWGNKIVNWVDTKNDNEERKSLVVECQLEAISCRQCKDNEIDLSSLIGTAKTEGFFLANADDLGKVKAFFVDIGMSGSGKLQELCDQSIGIEFVSPIKHRRDKNDTSKSYADIDRNVIESLSKAVAPIAPPIAPPKDSNLSL